jgi:hypothetical protein
MAHLHEAAMIVSPDALRRPHDIEVHDDLALVAGKGGSLAAIDVREPAEPKLLHHLDDPALFEETQTVLPLDDGTWLVGARSVHRVRLTPGGQIEVLQSVADRDRLDLVNGMAALAGVNSVIAACKTASLSSLTIDDDAAAPLRIASARDTHRLGEVRSPHDVAVHGDLVVVVDGAGRDPLHAMTVYHTGHATDAATDWQCAGRIADDRLHGANRVRAAFGHAYAACYRQARIAVARLPEEDRPFELTRVMDFHGRQPTGMCLRGRMLAVAGERSVEIFDLTEPALPRSVAAITSHRLFPAGGDSAHDLAYHRGFLLVTAQNDAAVSVFALDGDVRALAEAAT